MSQTEFEKARDKKALSFVKNFKGIRRPDGLESDPCLADLEITAVKSSNWAREYTLREVEELIEASEKFMHHTFCDCGSEGCYDCVSDCNIRGRLEQALIELKGKDGKG